MEVSGSNLGQVTDILTEVFCVFPQQPHEYYWDRTLNEVRVLRDTYAFVLKFPLNAFSLKSHMIIFYNTNFVIFLLQVGPFQKIGIFTQR